MPRIRKLIPGVDPKLLIKDAVKLMPDPTRRLFLRGGASLGALAFLTGCDIVDGVSAENALMKVSYFNDRVQAWLFDPNTLAPTYPDSAVTRPFPFNAYYPEDEAPEVDEGRLQARGRRSGRQQEDLDAGRAPRAAAGDPDHPSHLRRGLERDRQMERASAARFPASASAPTPRAKYVWFRCAEGYSTSIDMATALHPQTQMTFKFDGEILPRKYGFPMKVRIPTKLGFKNPKYVMEMAVINNWNPGLLGGAGLQLVQRVVMSARCRSAAHYSLLRRHLGDQPRAALEGEVVPQPGERDDEAVAWCRSGSRCAPRSRTASRQSP